MVKHILLLALVLVSVEGYAESTFGIHYARSLGEGRIKIGSAEDYRTHPQGGGFILTTQVSEVFGFAITSTILVDEDLKQLVSFGAGVSISSGQMTLIFMPTMLEGIGLPSNMSTDWGLTFTFGLQVRAPNPNVGVYTLFTPDLSGSKWSPAIKAGIFYNLR